MKHLDLKRDFDQYVAIAKESLKRDKQLVPVAFIFYKENVEILGLAIDKKASFAVIQAAAEEKKADAVLFIDDAWFKTSPKGQPIPTGSLKTDPASKEAIVAAMYGPAIKHIEHHPYIRKNGEIIFQKPEAFDGENVVFFTRLHPWWKEADVPHSA